MSTTQKLALVGFIPTSINADCISAEPARLQFEFEPGTPDEVCFGHDFVRTLFAGMSIELFSPGSPEENLNNWVSEMLTLEDQLAQCRQVRAFALAEMQNQAIAV